MLKSYYYIDHWAFKRKCNHIPDGGTPSFYFLWLGAFSCHCKKGSGKFEEIPVCKVATHGKMMWRYGPGPRRIEGMSVLHSASLGGTLESMGSQSLLSIFSCIILMRNKPDFITWEIIAEPQLGWRNRSFVLGFQNLKGILKTLLGPFCSRKTTEISTQVARMTIKKQLLSLL